MVLLNHRKNLAKKFQKGLKAMNRTKTANKINAVVEIQNQFVFIFTANEEATNKEENEVEAMTEDERLDEEERLDREWEETTAEREATITKINTIDNKLIDLKMCYDNWNLAICKKTGSLYYRTCNWCGGNDIFITDNLEEALENRNIIKEQIDELEEQREQLCNKVEELMNKIYNIQHRFSILDGDED